MFQRHSSNIPSCLATWWTFLDLQDNLIKIIATTTLLDLHIFYFFKEIAFLYGEVSYQSSSPTLE